MLINFICNFSVREKVGAMLVNASSLTMAHVFMDNFLSTMSGLSMNGKFVSANGVPQGAIACVAIGSIENSDFRRVAVGNAHKSRPTFFLAIEQGLYFTTWNVVDFHLGEVAVVSKNDPRINCVVSTIAIPNAGDQRRRQFIYFTGTQDILPGQQLCVKALKNHRFVSLTDEYKLIVEVAKVCIR